MKRKLVIVVEDIGLTRLMRDADMFEEFKFLGRVLVCTQAGEPATLPAAQVLERLTKHDGEGFRTVGVVIPCGDAYFTPGYRVFSNGDGWCTVEQMCEHYSAKLEETRT